MDTLKCRQSQPRGTLTFGASAREAHIGALSDADLTNGADIEAAWLGICGMGFWVYDRIDARSFEVIKCRLNLFAHVPSSPKEWDIPTDIVVQP